MNTREYRPYRAHRIHIAIVPIDSINPFALSTELPGRAAAFGRWFVAHPDETVIMPRLVQTPRGLEFCDGRHRFAWLSRMGVTEIPCTIEGMTA